MKKTKLYTIYLIALVTLYTSCQDKYLTATIQPAKGTLKADASDSCLPKTIAGIYRVGKEMNDTNFLQVTVNVTSPGTYTIQTDSANGVSFKASGNFSVTGLNTVKLAATGKPVSAGVKLFTVRFDGSACTVAITMDPLVTPSSYTLQGSPSACMLDTVFGIYAASASLDTSNHISITVNVSVAGPYTISTGTVNGYSFAGAGTFTTTGTQTVTLSGTGIPQTAGTNNFTITGASTSCTIPVTVVAPIAVTNNEYFPLTANSYWNYDNLYNVGDTLGRIIVSDANFSGNLFKVMDENDQRLATVEYYYRKSDSGYYEYSKVDRYTRALSFTPAVEDQILFLKANLATGDSWTSPEYIGKITGGQQIYLQYKFVCDNANGAVTIGGKTFAHVYKISMIPQVRSAITYPYNTTGELITIYYARGVGIVYYRFLNRSFVVAERQIRNWMVY